MPAEPICIGLGAHERVASDSPDLVSESDVSSLVHRARAFAYTGKRVGVLHDLQEFEISNIRTLDWLLGRLHAAILWRLAPT